MIRNPIGTVLNYYNNQLTNGNVERNGLLKRNIIVSDKIGQRHVYTSLSIHNNNCISTVSHHKNNVTRQRTNITNNCITPINVQRVQIN